MARRSLVLAMAAWVVAAALHAASAQSPPVVISPTLHHDVIDVKEKKLLLTLRGWNEEDGDRPDEVTAVSLTEFPTGAVAEIRARFTRDTPPRCVSWHAVLRDRSGTELSSASERVVPDAFPLLTKPLPPNAYPPLAPLGYVLAHVGLGNAQQRASFHFILPNGSLIQMDLWVDGREMVDVPAGKFDAYRVYMRAKAESVFPNLPGFLMPFVSFFIPTQTIWLTAQEPQMLIKFTGQMGPPGSPQLLIQLASVDQP
jgi:hypothetical protein